MNRIFRISFFLSAVFSLFSPLHAQNDLNSILASGKFFPDVMNKINVMLPDKDGNLRGITYDLDTFPIFSGFPKSATGQSFEGGIYCQMDSDAPLEIVYGIGSTIQAWNIDGTNVPGWPVTLSYQAEGAPAFGDIDGDGQEDIVINSRNFTSTAGAIYAYRKNGTLLPGFPIVNGAPTRSVVLADMDNDGKLEIITNKRLSNSGEIYVYKGNGTIFPGWPKTLDHVPASSSAVGDITGDGVPEVISESYNSVFAWDKNGVILPGFPFTMPNGDNNSYSAPVLADMDGDTKRDIVFGTHKLSGIGYVYILKNDGTVFPNWPKTTGQWIYGPPVAGLIDGDNIMDVVIGDQVASGVPLDYIYGWNKDGTVIAGFPVGPLNAINNQVSIGDIDGDNQYDMIVDDNTTSGGFGKYLAYHITGSPVTGWPLQTTGTTFFNMPSLADLNLDGKIDIVGAGLITGGSGSINVYVWNTGFDYHPGKIINPVWQYNVRHNGVYGDNNLVGIAPISNEIPNAFKLFQNYPNPFNPTTKIKFSIPPNASGNVLNTKISVFDILGREIAVLLDDNLNSGTFEIDWNAENVSSGIYFYRITAGKYSEIRRMVLLK